MKTASRPSAANSGLGGAGAPGPLLSVSVTPAGSCSPVVVGWGFLPAGTWVPPGQQRRAPQPEIVFRAVPAAFPSSGCARNHGSCDLLDSPTNCIMLLRNRESSLSEGFPNETIRIEVNLPIVLIVTIRAHSQQLPGRSELQDLYVRRGLTST